ncbi:ABC transporter permease [Xenophilus arseniciresistens]|uniref:ABC transporter permease n=1 Tax=Xenophilus arseniciresistens TaxID=1283306 RepID=A0AAE3NB68_9BURK|nr:ABC transporter permease [Xenophilus arseniciresistens]MDA7418293.1 ABC transporter permease [Xenophilus arseniciresistens]
MKAALSPVLRQRLLSALALVGFFVLWELVCLAFGVSDLVLPRPSQIAAVLLEKMPLLWAHTAQTLYTTLAGFALGVLAGVVIGVAIGSSRMAYDVAYPLMVGFSSIPKVAVVPLFVVWFGAGTVPAVLTSMVICIFPVVVNVATGLASTEPELEDVLRVLGARKRDILWNVGLPRTMPYLFASLKIAITLSFVGTVLAETVASNKGIGTVMMIASGNFDVPMVFAGLFLLAAMGVMLYAISSLAERRVTGWAQRKTDLAASGA